MKTILSKGPLTVLVEDVHGAFEPDRLDLNIKSG